tara:strand:+ start:443 stop:1585 length:1143 start_codon:yes stop_codon:yes gene_type:complete
MKLKLKNTPEQVELIKALGSKNPAVAREASEAFAAFLGPVIQQVLLQAGTAGRIYTDAPFNEDDSPSYPLDLYYNEGVGNISIWSQTMAGGLPTSMVSGGQELKIATYRLDSAVGFLKKYARRSRLDVVSKGLERMAQEILVKQERNAWAVVLKALANAVTGTQKHVIGSTTANVFQVHDMNRLITLNKRLNESFADGTPEAAYSNGVTDLFLSPEVMEQVRAFAYQPMNTRTVGTGNDIALPDSIRENVFRAAGMPEIYGVTLNELLELGVAQKYNVLFGSIITSDGATGVPTGGDNGALAHDSASAFLPHDNELVVGVDNSKGAFIRPVATADNASGGSFTVLPDDQFTQRADKIGFYGFLEEGRVCIDSRAIAGIVV